MGVFAIGVKTPPAPPACGYDSIALAIANPLVAEDYGDTLDLQADDGKFGASQYNSPGANAGFTVNFAAQNAFDSGAAMTVYTVNSSGTVIDTIIHGDGVINPGDTVIEVPLTSPFYVVVENVGGDSCDYFEVTFYDAS